VSVDGTTYPLPQPYFVIATQNPVELEGTYPLPEAQLDRFMARASLGYPTREHETAMLLNARGASPLDGLGALCTPADVVTGIEAAATIKVDSSVADYLVSLVSATREHADIKFGASPRASLNLLAMCKSRALLNHRDFITPDDVQALTEPVLAHRIVVRRAFSRTTRTQTPAEVLRKIIADLPVPRPALN
jgi:MoxR-like ATPase